MLCKMFKKTYIYFTNIIHYRPHMAFCDDIGTTTKYNFNFAKEHFVTGVFKKCSIFYFIYVYITYEIIMSLYSLLSNV